MSSSPLWAAVLGTGAVVWGGYTHQLARRSASWPTVEGTVIQSALAYASSADRNKPDFQRERILDLKYRYRVDGVSYDGRVVSYSDDGPLATLWPSENDARIVARYPRDARVTVHYDPADPARAVLEAGGGRQSVLMVLGGLGAIGWAAWAGARSGRNGMPR